MNRTFVCCLLLLITVACKKQNAGAASQLPEPDTAVISNAYTLVTAATGISPDSGTVYRLALAPYAAYFKFDRSIKNGDLYYEAILESTRTFSPLKFFILNNGKGEMIAIVPASATEVEKFNQQWQR